MKYLHALRNFEEYSPKKVWLCSICLLSDIRYPLLKKLRHLQKGYKKILKQLKMLLPVKKSNGFVEGTNSRLKMIRRTMYGRCSRQLLSAKLMYKKCCTT